MRINRARINAGRVNSGAFAHITGSLAAQEAGQDTFAALGSVEITGIAAAVESGADVFAASAGVEISASLAATETGADSFAASGAVEVSGSLVVSETGADQFSAAGSVEVSGSLATTESGQDTFEAVQDQRQFTARIVFPVERNSIIVQKDVRKISVLSDYRAISSRPDVRAVSFPRTRKPVFAQDAGAVLVDRIKRVQFPPIARQITVDADGRVINAASDSTRIAAPAETLRIQINGS